MKSRNVFLMLSAIGVLGLVPSCVTQPASMVPSDSNYREHPEWCKGAEDRLAAMRGKDCDLIFVGDSITGMWDSAGLEVWNKYYASRKALNFGAGGDRTQNALWRLQQWKLETLKPKAAVVLIGTNNIDNPMEELVAGVKAVVSKTRELFPSAKLILVSVLPRADWPTHAAKVRELNALLKASADGRHVLFLDIAPKFTPLGDSYKGLGPDKLHLSGEGYAIWAEALEPLLKEILGEK